MMFTLSPFTLSFCLPLAVVLYGMSPVIFLQCLADDVHIVTLHCYLVFPLSRGLSSMPLLVADDVHIVTLHCSLVFPMSHDLPLTLLPMMFIPFCILSTVLSCCMVNICMLMCSFWGLWGVLRLSGLKAPTNQLTN